MKGDFSRSSFDAAKHFSQVLMQQGRVMLDADHNEQGAILLHALRMLTRDLFGAHGGPAAGGGFGLTLVAARANSPPALTIGAGHYYVDGILCESDGCSYDTQPDYSPANDDPFSAWLKAPVTGKFYWLYLDVWERHISWVEDDSIREVALGGPDTCTRSRVVWQVKAIESIGNSPPSCDVPATFTALSSAWLAARLDPGSQLPDPCVLAPDAKYRGAENQLYRVEVHQGGTLAAATSDADRPSFKWSRDNGSVAVPWLDTDGSDLVVTRTRGFDAGIWVELSDDSNDIHATPGQLVKLIQVQGDRLSVDPATVPATGLPLRNAALHPRVRRWDQADSDAVSLVRGAVPIIESKGGTGPDAGWTLVLEDGIEVLFSPAGAYRAGDYWLIPARVARGSIEWPTTTDASGATVPAARAPFGIEHHYAPLGVASFGFGNNKGAAVSNCRNCFGQLPAAPCTGSSLSPVSKPPGAIVALPQTSVAAAVAARATRTAGAGPATAKPRKGA